MNKVSENTVRTVVKGLKKASKSHAAQAKKLEKVLKSSKGRK